jgi:hypothetical protein
MRNFSNREQQTRRSATRRIDQGPIVAEVRSMNPYTAIGSLCGYPRHRSGRDFAELDDKWQDVGLDRLIID